MLLFPNIQYRISNIFLKVFFIITFFVLVDSVSAVENNKFGIHLAQPHFQDLEAAAKLVNSSGGDWGYVTLVIQENDRDRGKWQEIFDRLRELHLIPIIRLATKPEGSSWRRPQKNDGKEWADFLDSLNWVVKNRYVVLFNEPNHGSEWGGAVDPQDYAQVAFSFAKALKEKNKDFFVMLAGLDASAPHQMPQFEDEEIFLKELLFTARELVESENTQKNSNQNQSSGNLNVGSNIPDIRLHIISSNLKLSHVKNIARIISNVNTINAFKPAVIEKFGVINTTLNQPADRLIDNPENVLKRAFFDFLEKENFIKTIKAEEKISVNKDLFDYIDGWASHSYPNPGFSGSPLDSGRGTVRTYRWELELLRSLGVNKDLPVFITETGWKRDIRYSILDIGNDRIAENFKIAFEQIWGPDERVLAVTPFVLDYQSEPFLGFSWRKYQSQEFYPLYYAVQSLPKTKGAPERVEKGEIDFDLPKELLEQSTYQFKIKLKNFGQAIWDKNEGYSILDIRYWKSKEQLVIIKMGEIGKIKPFEEREVNFFVETVAHREDVRSKIETVGFELRKNGKKILENSPPAGGWQFKIIPLPSLKFNVNLFPKLNEKGDDFEIQIFDEREKLIFKKSKLKVEHGVGIVGSIQYIIPGKKYRLVVLKPYYLPRQNFLTFQKGENKIKFKPLIPADFDRNGRLSFGDFISLIKNPLLFKLFLP
ncbi:MAG: hypothetical protein ACK4FL_02540 [Microgenomates group bacterium]